jgi:hypothetical protein
MSKPAAAIIAFLFVATACAGEWTPPRKEPLTAKGLDALTEKPVAQLTPIEIALFAAHQSAVVKNNLAFLFVVENPKLRKGHEEIWGRHWEARQRPAGCRILTTAHAAACTPSLQSVVGVPFGNA